MPTRILDYLRPVRLRKKAGKRTTDIALPNESGMRDPRLPSAEDEQVQALTMRNRMFKELAGQ